MDLNFHFLGQGFHEIFKFQKIKIILTNHFPEFYYMKSVIVLYKLETYSTLD